MKRNEFYLAALLHDIGKFTERTKNQKLEEKFKLDIYHGHPKYSAQLLDVLKEHSFFKQYSNELVEAVLYHHEPKNIYHKIIQLADWYSSRERLSDEENKEKYYEVPMESIFSNIFSGTEKPFYYNLNKLNFDNIMPANDNQVNKYNYRNLLNDFLSELKYIKNEKQLYYLLEKYLWSVPAQTYKHKPDVSLFDHSKTTAAIALCLYDQYKNGDLDESHINKLINKNEEDINQFILIGGDLSGIQDFIFNITSKKASKSLKGRSVYLDLLSRVITQYILNVLNLKESNLLYNGGGNFYILAPLNAQEKLDELKVEISHKILKAHKGQLYYNLESLELNPEDFNRFNDVWSDINRSLEIKKKHKWQEIIFTGEVSLLFGPEGDGTIEQMECKSCGNIKENLSSDRCNLCDSFVDLTNSIKNARFLFINEKSINSIKKSDSPGYNEIFGQFGYQLSFAAQDGNSDWKYLLNSTDFLKDDADGFTFGAYQLPMRDNRQIEFEEMATPVELNDQNIVTGNKLDEGDVKLGILKMDIDNLGQIFTQGLKSDSSISRLTSLSRMFGLFFEGYINKIIWDKNWQENIYVTFSGGDDSFVIGTWNVIFEFASEFNKVFKDFTCWNKDITISAGLNTFRYNFPVIRSADITESLLNEVKQTDQINENNLPVKNKINFLGEEFTWEEFRRIKNLKDILVKVVDKTGKKTVLHKVRKSTLGFKILLKDSNAGIFKNVKFWRLAYYLREVKEEVPDLVEDIINEYEDIIKQNLLARDEKKKVKSIMIIPAAVRWAEMVKRN